MTTASSTEQRRHQRVAFKKSIKIKTDSREVFTGYLAQDISRGGLRMNCEDFVPIGAQVVVQLQLQAETRVLEMPCKVAWVKFARHLDAYQMGLEFSGDRVFAEWKIAKFVGKA